MSIVHTQDLARDMLEAMEYSKADKLATVTQLASVKDVTSDTDGLVWFEDTGQMASYKGGIPVGNIITILPPSNTDVQNTSALQELINADKTIYMPGGTYPIRTLYFKNGTKILSSTNDKIHFIRSNGPGTIFDCRNVAILNDVEFHGILENTWVSATDTDTSLIAIGDVNGTSSNCNFDDVEYIATGHSCNGLKLLTSFFGAPSTFRVKNLSAKRSKFNCGRMGIEVNNAMDNFAITGISIAAPAVFTASIALTANKLIENDPVMLINIVGAAQVSRLNEQIYYATNVSGSTFQLKDVAGNLVSTVGGTYTSGGNVHCYRVSNLTASDSEIVAAGLISQFGIGISLSGPIMDCKLNNITSRDARLGAIELIGGTTGIEVDALRLVNASGDSFHNTSTSIFCYNNRITNMVSVGDIKGSCVLKGQKGLLFKGNHVSHLGAGVGFIKIKNCTITENNITSKTYSAMEFGDNGNVNRACTGNSITKNYVRVVNHAVPGLILNGANVAGNFLDENVLEATATVTVPVTNYSAGVNAQGKWRDVNAVVWS